MRPLWLILAAAALHAQGEGGLGENRLDQTNRKAAEQVRRTVAKQGRMLSVQLKGLNKEDVIVVGGLFDFTQELLRAFEVPHTVVTPAELEYVPMKRPERMVFFLNCHLLDREFPPTQRNAPRPDEAAAARRLEAALKAAGLDGATAPGKAIRERFKEVMYFAGSDYSRKGLARMAAAVKAGAWVWSMDWALLALEHAFPGSIRWTGHTTAEETIEIRPSSAGRRDSLMKGVFEDRKKAKWWLETESYLFAVKARHTTLIESRALAARYHGNRKVVVLFDVGKGRVLHALAHSYLQKGNAGDAAVMQHLLVNYLIEKSLQNYKREFDAGKRNKAD